jgi:hypothetical protein
LGTADEGHWIARFTSSWSTTDADVDALAAALPEKDALLKANASGNDAY